MSTMVYFQFVFAAITVILLAGALLCRMNFKAWMVFVPLWITFSYTVGKCLRAIKASFLNLTSVRGLLYLGRRLGFPKRCH